MVSKSGFTRGVLDGLPICLGYLSVSFAFGIFSVKSGLSVIETLLISMTNVTSAGQLAGVPIIAAAGSLSELAATQFVINLRYSLMSVSLSQKLGRDVNLFDRFVFAFVNTDEVFAVASSKEGKVGKFYMYGLILLPFVGWSVGTFIGASAGSIFPPVLVSCLGVAIYGMFIAIITPVARRDKAVAICVLISVALSCAFRGLCSSFRLPHAESASSSAALARLSLLGFPFSSAFAIVYGIPFPKAFSITDFWCCLQISSETVFSSRHFVWRHRRPCTKETELITK